MSKKSLRFNYFTLYLKFESGKEKRWDFEEILKHINSNKNRDFDFEVGIEKGELDINAFHYEDDLDIYFFQIAKLRDRNIPDLKKLRVPRRRLPLEKNEYVSEFLTFIYDTRNEVAAIQTNKYSLTVNELEIYLTKLRASIVGEENGIVDVELRVVPDPDKLAQIKKADYVRKISIKSSKINLDALVDESSLKKVSEVIGQYEGLEFTLEVGLGRSAKMTDSLNKGRIISTIESLESQNKKSDNFDLRVNIKDDADTPQETINLLEPRMTDLIQLESDNRNDLGAEYIFNNFYEEKYKARRKGIKKYFKLE